MEFMLTLNESNLTRTLNHKSVTFPAIIFLREIKFSLFLERDIVMIMSFMTFKPISVSPYVL
jgi:hypothetical protein